MLQCAGGPCAGESPIIDTPARRALSSVLVPRYLGHRPATDRRRRAYQRPSPCRSLVDLQAPRCGGRSPRRSRHPPPTSDVRPRVPGDVTPLRST